MRRYISIASALLLTISAAAQNLNPTVQVTNAYDGKLMDMSKKNIPMNVPDSLFRFDWNFNYSVFDNPYKGAYEFNPYVIEMKPDASVYDGTRLYVRAGAGYSLHPEAQVVWNPNLKGRFGITLYDDFKGFWGPYSDVTCETLESGSYKLAKGDAVNGSDMKNRVGAVLRYDLPSSILTFDTNMDYIRTDTKGTSFVCDLSPLGVSNSVIVNRNVFRARSNAPVSPFSYDVAAHFDYLKDKSTAAYNQWNSMADEMAFGGDAMLGYDFTSIHGIGLHADVDRYVSGGNDMLAGEVKNMSSTVMDVTPMYRLSMNRLHLEAGVKLSKIWRNHTADSIQREYESVNFDSSSYPTDGTEDDVPDYKGRLVYPHVKIDFELVDDALVLFAGVTGGHTYNSIASYMDGDHRFSACTRSSYFRTYSNPTVTTVDASLGLRGRIAHRLEYKIDGGFARLYDAPVEGLDFVVGDRMFFNYDMTNYDLIYGDIETAWASDRFDASVDMRFQKSDFRNFNYAATLPLFSGSSQFRYIWNKRVYAGIDVEWATRRKATGEEIDDVYVYSSSQMPYSMVDYSCRIPGWVDLGVSAEYKINSKFGVWLKGGNLLNQMVMNNLMVAQRGPYFTLGLCLNL